MKKLLNRWFCYTLVLLCSAMYAQPCTFEDVVKKTTYDIPYEKYNANLDMLAVLNYKKTDFYGFIGVNRKRLRITFTSIKKSEENKDLYEVEGFSTVMNKNKRTFKGTFSLRSHYKFTEPTFEEPLKNGDIEGFSTFSYQLSSISVYLSGQFSANSETKSKSKVFPLAIFLNKISKANCSCGSK